MLRAFHLYEKNTSLMGDQMERTSKGFLGNFQKKYLFVVLLQ